MDSPQPNNPALRLAQYLKDFVGLRTTTVRDVAKYDAVLWFGEMPQHKDCFSPAWMDGTEPGEPWLEVRKQVFEAMPAPPEAILAWIDEKALRRAPEQMPALRNSILIPDQNAELVDGESKPLIEVPLSDYPDVKTAYERYRPHWQEWSDEHRRRQTIQDLYAKLFSLHTQLRKQGELVELVIGVGLLDWRAPVGGKVIPIRRHLIVARAELEFDPGKGVMRLLPPGDGARLHIEDDMLEAELRPDRSQYQAVHMQLNNIGDEIWDKALIYEAIKYWAGALNADSLWSQDLQVRSADPTKPVVSFAPALILRKRTQTGMVRIYNALIDQLSDSSLEVPHGWVGLIDDIADFADDDTGNIDQPISPLPDDGHTREIFFPLPANKEQRRIVEAIERQRGALVQGPPGTGKSHTIANLICHLLATGKRVLITAETGRALQVLKDKLPEQIQPLCVSLLGQGGDAFAELNTAVQGITTRQATYTPGAYEPRIAEINDELDESRRALAKIDSEIRSLREEETCPHEIADGAYVGTASSIADRVAQERSHYGWLNLPNDSGAQPTVRRDDMLDWLAICRRYSPEQIANAQLKFPPTKELVDPQTLSALVANEAAARDTLESAEGVRHHPAYEAIRGLGPAQRGEIGQLLRQLEQKRLSVARIADGWAQAALRDLIGGRRARWETVLARHRELYADAVSLTVRVGNVVVDMPEAHDRRRVCADAQAAVAYLNGGGSWKRLGMFTPAELKGKTYLKDEVTVDGVGAASQEQLQAVVDDLSLGFVLEELLSVWCEVGATMTGGSRRLVMAELDESRQALERCIAFADACSEAAGKLAAASPPVPGPAWLGGEIAQWLELFRVAALDDSHNAARQAVEQCAEALSRVGDLHDAHPLVSSMTAALAQRDIGLYSQFYSDIEALEELISAQSRRREVESNLEESVPGLVSYVQSTIDDEAWQVRFSSWESAWYWAAADSWLEKRADFSYQQNLWRRRHELDASIGRLVAEVAALRAWAHFFNRLSATESAALKSWREAVRAMGKGTGKSARIARLRREARQYMDACRDAIPIWVMPRYLVAEMIDPKPERYDLVIVDEASQLGIDSLFLFYIAKKMVVVGDDQQISPYGIGIADEALAGLQDHYLDGIPHRHALSPQSSLYGNAKIRYSQNIVLREHFRCMPEIIQFCNDLCYASNGTPLDPLRAYPANRLQPLVVRHISDGYRTGSAQYAQNIPEADAIVSQIAGCIQDPRYTGKTMGVISLQGEAQAKLIERKLLERIEPEVIEERQLICGDAYAFQGDERHIIFLSMVAAPGETRIGALTAESARQRFNVAVSRAQDQLWLFHTATLDVLSDLCMRYRLLKYMLEPKREVSVEQDQQFDSEFERAVYQRIAERGFYVRTQVCVGDPTNHRFRIDLVVEGMQGRLAVECDGDKWHGPERYESDMARQRDLERAGWQFVRIRGGDFYRDPDSAMQPVWGELERLGIQPGGVDTDAAAPPPPVTFDEFDAGSDLPEQDPSDGDEDGSPVGGNNKLPQQNPEVAEQPSDDDSETGQESTGRQETNESEQEPSDEHPDRSVYVRFQGQISADPRNMYVGTLNIAKELFQVIDAEAPVLVKRAYDVYLRACGIQRMGGELRKTMNQALQHLLKQNRIVKEDELGKRDLLFCIVRPSGSPAVRVRERGPREFSEIPPSEVLTVARRLAASHGMRTGSDEHLRAVLEYFDLRRLTVQTGSLLLEILGKDYPYV